MNYKIMQLTQEDYNQIAQAIKEGYTSGRIDNDEGNGENSIISWSLTAEKWQD